MAAPAGESEQSSGGIGYTRMAVLLPQPGKDPSPSQLFASQILRFLMDRGEGRPDMLLPVVQNRPLDLRTLYNQVMAKGGMEQVSKDHRWDEIVQELDFPAMNALTTSVVMAYDVFLYDYERHQRGERYPPKVRQRLTIHQAYLLAHGASEADDSSATAQDDSEQGATVAAPPTLPDVASRASRIEEVHRQFPDALRDAESLAAWPGHVAPPELPRNPPLPLGRGHLPAYSTAVATDLHASLEQAQQPPPAGSPHAGTHVFSVLRDRLRQAEEPSARLPPSAAAPASDPARSAQPGERVRTVMQAIRSTAMQRVCLSLVSGVATEVLWALHTLARALHLAGPGAEALHVVLPDNPGLMDTLSCLLDECDVPLRPRGVPSAVGSGDDGSVWRGVGPVGAAGMDLYPTRRWTALWNKKGSTAEQLAEQHSEEHGEPLLAWVSGDEETMPTGVSGDAVSNVARFLAQEARLAGATAHQFGYGRPLDKEDASEENDDEDDEDAADAEEEEGARGPRSTAEREAAFLRGSDPVFPAPSIVRRAEAVWAGKTSSGWVDESQGAVHASIADEADAFALVSDVSDQPWRRAARCLQEEREEPATKRRRTGKRLSCTRDPSSDDCPAVDLDTALFPWRDLSQLLGKPLPEIYKRHFPQTPFGQLARQTVPTPRESDSLAAAVRALSALVDGDADLEDPVGADFGGRMPDDRFERPQGETTVFLWAASMVVLLLRKIAQDSPDRINTQAISLHPRLLRSLVRLSMAADKHLAESALLALALVAPLLDLTGRRYSMSIGAVLSSALPEKPRQYLVRSTRLFFEQCARSVLVVGCDAMFADEPSRMRLGARLVSSLSHAPENLPYLDRLPLAVLRRFVELLEPPVPSVETLRRPPKDETGPQAVLFDPKKDLRHRRNPGTDPLVAYDQWERAKQRETESSNERGTMVDASRLGAMNGTAAASESSVSRMARRNQLVEQLTAGHSRHPLRGDLAPREEEGGEWEPQEETDVESWDKWFEMPGQSVQRRRAEAWRVPGLPAAPEGKSSREARWMRTGDRVHAVDMEGHPVLPHSALTRRDCSLEAVQQLFRTKGCLRSRFARIPLFVDRLITALSTTAGSESVPSVALGVLSDLADDATGRKELQTTWADRLRAALEATRPMDIMVAQRQRASERRARDIQRRVHQGLRHLMFKIGVRMPQFM